VTWWSVNSDGRRPRPCHLIALIVAVSFCYDPAPRSHMDGSGAARVAYLPYNWDLNDQAKRH
jgi:hypothetical protein